MEVGLIDSLEDIQVRFERAFGLEEAEVDMKEVELEVGLVKVVPLEVGQEEVELEADLAKAVPLEVGQEGVEL